MRIARLHIVLCCLLAAGSAVAGGRMDLVAFPDGYQKDFTRYLTTNRANGKAQMVHIYANDTALHSAGEAQPLDQGAILVMEVYKAEEDAEGNPLESADGTYKPGKLAAIAVMEKRDWGDIYPEVDRSGKWGFGFYDGGGQPKPNDLDCAGCHDPLTQQDYLFSLSALNDFARNRDD